jgi:GNAT superfamily N-acetyltransferase
MAGMSAGDEQVLAEADRNMVAIWRHLAGTLPTSGVTERDGLILLSSGLPVPLFNPVYVTGELTDPTKAVATIHEHYAALGLPFVLVFRDAVAPGLADACNDASMVEHWQLPLMVMDPIPEHGDGEPMPAGLEIVVVDDHNISAYGDVLAGGFGMPRELVDQVLGPELVRVPGFTGFLGLLDGHPVASSGLYVSEDTAGVYNVATLEPARGKGIGAALTWAAALAGQQMGMRRSVLQASEMGEPVYERMGYVTPARYRQFEAAPSTT